MSKYTLKFEASFTNDEADLTAKIASILVDAKCDILRAELATVKSELDVQTAWAKAYSARNNEARDELAATKARLETACHIKADDANGFDWAVLDKIAALEAEIARMREALTEIEHGAAGYWNEPPFRETLMRHIMELARAALIGDAK